MNLWIRLSVSSPREPKVLALASDLDVEPMQALGMIVAVWCGIGEHAPDGDLSRVTDIVLESWACWRGERGAFARSYRAAFMDGDRMPGWDRLQGKLIEHAKRERERKSVDAASAPRKRRGSSAPTVRNSTVQQTTTSPAAPAPWVEPARAIWLQHVGVVKRATVKDTLGDVVKAIGDEAMLKALVKFVEHRARIVARGETEFIPGLAAFARDFRSFMPAMPQAAA